MSKSKNDNNEANSELAQNYYELACQAMNQYPTPSPETTALFDAAKKTMQDLIDLKNAPTIDKANGLLKTERDEKLRLYGQNPEQVTELNPKDLDSNSLLEKANDVLLNKLRTQAKAMPGTNKGKVIGSLLLLVGTALCLGATVLLAPHIALIGLGLFFGLSALGYGSIMGGIAAIDSRARFSPIGRLLNRHATLFNDAPRVEQPTNNTERPVLGMS